MKKFLFWTVLTLLLILLLSGICWFYADRLVDDFARPKIEILAAKFLASKVEIGRLRWTESGLEAIDLKILNSQVKGFLPRVAVDFTLTSLLNRRLDRLLISNPQLEFTTSRGQEKAAVATLKFPGQLALAIGQLRIRNGRLSLNTPGQVFQFHQLNLSGSLQSRSPFNLSGMVGQNDRHPITVEGTIQFSPQQSLILEGVSWQGRQLLEEPLSLAQIDGELGLNGGQISLPSFDEEQLQSLLLALGQPSLLPDRLAFSLTDPQARFSLADDALQLELQVVRGQLSWDQVTSPFSALQVRLKQTPQGWEIDGQFLGPADTAFALKAEFDQDNHFSGKALVKIPDPGNLKATLLGAPALKLKGALDLVTQFSWEPHQLKLATEIQGHAGTSPVTEYLLDIEQLSGHAQLQLVNGQENFTLSVQKRERPLFSASGNFRKVKASLSAADLETIRQLLPAEQIPPQLQALGGIKIAGRVSMTGGAWIGRINLSATEGILSGVSFHKATAQGEISYSDGQFICKDLSFKADAAYGDTLAGKISGRASASYANGAYSLVLAQLSASELNYNSADGLSGIAAASASLQGRIDGRWPPESVELNLVGTLSAQEVLSGVFYANLSSHQADIELVGNLSPRTKTLTAEKLTINLPKIGKLKATAQLGPEQVSSQGQLDLVELASSYGAQLKPLLRDVLPQLSDLNLSGQLATDYLLRWEPAGWRINGEVAIRDLTAQWARQQLDLADGNGALPFALGNGTLSDGTVRPGKTSGEVDIGLLSVGQARLKQRKLRLIAELNGITISTPLQLALAGGTLTMSDISLGWPNGKPQGALKIDISGVELEPLTRELDLPVMQGSFSASLGTIRYRDRQFSTDGIARIEVFGGQFQFSRMRYNEPFSRHPRFSTDIEFTGLDLQQATRTFDFGEMNGIIDGYVTGLELYGTTPAAFVASLATRESGTRNISVKALNNLSILSQGGISAALSRGIYRFIDFYRYRKIAFDCSLVNDTFTLIGTALPGSDRYLVYGGLLPPRIDITTTTPTISFKEMVKRLGRIDRAGSGK